MEPPNQKNKNRDSCALRIDSSEVLALADAPKIDSGSHARTSTKSAPECDLEPVWVGMRIGTLGPRLNA